MAWGWTRAERRGASAVLALYLLGTAWDLYRAAHPAPREGGAPHAPPPAAAAAVPAPGPAPDSAVDLNLASESELDRLPGIGPVLARRITAHRTRFGSFRRVEDLRAVRGVGPRLYQRIASRVRVGEIALRRPAPSDSAAPAAPRAAASAH